MENKVYQNGYEKYLTEMKDVLKNDKEDILKQEKLSDEQKEMQPAQTGNCSQIQDFHKRSH